MPMSRSTLGRLLSDCKSSSDQVLIQMFFGCWLSINQDEHQVAIKMLIECWSSVDRVHIDMSIKGTQLQMSCVHDPEYFGLMGTKLNLFY